MAAIFSCQNQLGTVIVQRQVEALPPTVQTESLAWLHLHTVVQFPTPEREAVSEIMLRLKGRRAASARCPAAYQRERRPDFSGVSV